MAKIKSKSKSSGSKASAKSSAKSEAVAVVVANPRLVEALQKFDVSKQQTQSYLIEVAEIAQEEQLSRAEIVASIMEARGIEKSSAESQYSRMKAILTNPEALEELRDGDADLKTIREKTTKKQKNPSSKKKAENLEKRYTTAITQIVTCAKEGGYDLASVLNAVKSALKKNGIR